MSEHNQQIGLVSRGDVVRAIRQSITDAGIDLKAMVKEAVDQAVEKRISEYNFTATATVAAEKMAKGSLYEIRNAVAQEVARRIRMD